MNQFPKLTPKDAGGIMNRVMTIRYPDLVIGINRMVDEGWCGEEKMHALLAAMANAVQDSLRGDEILTAEEVGEMYPYEVAVLVEVVERRGLQDDLSRFILEIADVFHRQRLFLGSYN